MRLLATRGLGIGLALACALPALAGEGVIELNDTCAKGSGCLSGDSPGLPIQIFAPGSYRLTSDILGNALAYDAIVEINAEAVTLDLNGFSIVGPGAAVGSQGAISGGHRVTVRNGFVRFALNDGVQLGGSSRVDDLHVHGSGRDGVRIAGEGSVRNVVATSNGGNGITAGAASVVDGCTATANGSSGISLPSGAVRGSTATQNGNRGGDFGPNVTFATNLFIQNGVGDIAYGHASGGNICSDASCTTDGRRRYYLSRTNFAGSVRASACDTGYHPASVAELVDPTQLAYDFGRGQDGGTIAPGRKLIPEGYGWVYAATHHPAPAFSGLSPECAEGTTDPADNATVIRFNQNWNAAATALSPWERRVVPCVAATLSDLYPVWCVEN